MYGIFPEAGQLCTHGYGFMGWGSFQDVEKAPSHTVPGLFKERVENQISMGSIDDRGILIFRPSMLSRIQWLNRLAMILANPSAL